MQSQALDVDGRRVIVIVCDKGEDPIAAITDAAGRHGVYAAQITAVGGFHRAMLGYFDRDRLDYNDLGRTDSL
jgi:predicted DNA-binding protein with PD1-like motif